MIVFNRSRSSFDLFKVFTQEVNEKDGAYFLLKIFQNSFEWVIFFTNYNPTFLGKGVYFFSKGSEALVVPMFISRTYQVKKSFVKLNENFSLKNLKVFSTHFAKLTANSSALLLICFISFRIRLIGVIFNAIYCSLTMLEDSKGWVDSLKKKVLTKQRDVSEFNLATIKIIKTISSLFLTFIKFFKLLFCCKIGKPYILLLSSTSSCLGLTHKIYRRSINERSV